MMKARMKFLSQVVALALGGITVPVLAATFNVNTTADATDAAPGNGVCADASGKCSLRAAVQEANALLGSKDTIVLPAGTYVLTRPGGSEDAAFTGDLDITSDIGITGTRAPDTIIDGGQLDRLFHVLGNGTLDMTHVTLRNGMAGNEGGGIMVEHGIAHLSGVSVTKNRAAKGGGIAVIAGGGVTELDKVSVTENYASVDGGGIYNLIELYMLNSTVGRNTTPGNGGGIWNNGLIDMVNVTVGENSADAEGNNQGYGGGLANMERGRATITNTIVAMNKQGSAADNCYNAGVATTNHSLESGTDCNFVSQGDKENADPLFGALDLWGGEGPSFPLMTGSPALDAADENECPNVDQRGASRTSCDIGAFESPLPTDLRVSINAAPLLVDKDGQVVYTVTAASTGPVRPHEVWAEIVLPRNIGYVSSSVSPAGGCAVAGETTVKCQFGPLQPGQTGSATVVATALGGGVGRATVTAIPGIEPDPDQTNNTDSVDVEVKGGGGGAFDWLLLAGLPLLALRRRRG